MQESTIIAPQPSSKIAFEWKAILLAISKTKIYKTLHIGATMIMTLIDLIRVGFFDSRADIGFLVVTFCL